MDCQICGTAAVRSIKASGMHDPLVLCHAHAVYYFTVALTDGWSAVRFLMDAPLQVEPTETVEVSSMKDSRFIWDRPAPVTTPGAHTSSGVPQFRSHSWVNAFTHHATDPRKTWPTRG